tara:strand:- start:2196 stop:3254 length:1059 start_codon:yes stop_codon:yes gene_type:complete
MNNTIDILDAVKLTETCISHEFIPYLMGQSGIGKTTMFEQVAKRKGWAFKSYNCSYADFADWGLYVKKKKQHYYMKDTLDEKLVEQEVVEAVIPEHMQWIFTASVPTLVLIDELPLAPEMIQGNFMAIFNERHIRGKRISDNIYFVVAGNRAKDKVGGTPLKWPLVARMAVFEVACGVSYLNSWREYMIRKGVNPIYVAALEKIPEMLTDAKPNTTGRKEGGDPRAWDRALTVCSKTNLGNEDMRILLSSFVGESNASKFIGYLQVREAFPEIEEALKDPTNVNIPKDRPDIMYAFGSTIAFHASEDNIASVIELVRRFPEEFKNRIMKDIALRNPSIQGHELYISATLGGI